MSKVNFLLQCFVVVVVVISYGYILYWLMKENVEGKQAVS